MTERTRRTGTRLLAAAAIACVAATMATGQHVLYIPQLLAAPAIDGDLSEWRDLAYTDGLWDIERLQHTPWYDPTRNRLTVHGAEPPPVDDLQARYYMAWDSTYLYFGAEVRDNVNDVDDPGHEPARWYFKDCVCWFVEAPRDTLPEAFAQGDNAFCFVADRRRPDYGAWWRHGGVGAAYVEEPLPATAGDYRLEFGHEGGRDGDFTLEARINMAATLGRSDPAWVGPAPGTELGLMIVHTDPDGGGYGGHLLIYGAGDDDATWTRAVLVGPLEPLTRRVD